MAWTPVSEQQIHVLMELRCFPGAERKWGTEDVKIICTSAVPPVWHASVGKSVLLTARLCYACLQGKESLLT